MIYMKLIAEELNVSKEVAEIIMNKMSLGGFHFSTSSRETILEEARFIKTYCL